jgi:hypothetical protein
MKQCSWKPESICNTLALNSSGNCTIKINGTDETLSGYKAISNSAASIPIEVPDNCITTVNVYNNG